MPVLLFFLLFFFNDTATTEIYTLSLHDALPISAADLGDHAAAVIWCTDTERRGRDRKSTRLNSSHVEISYAVFCLKKKKKRDKYDTNKRKKKKKNKTQSKAINS